MKGASKPGTQNRVRIPPNLGAFFRCIFPNKAAAHIAAATGLPQRSAEKWLAGEAAPSGEALALLVAHFGPGVLVALVATPPRWLVEAATAYSPARVAAQGADLRARLRERRA